MNGTFKESSQSTGAQKIGLAIFIIASLVFTALLLGVTNHGSITQIDTAIYQTLQSMRTPIIDMMMIGFTEVGDTVVVVCTTIALLILLLACKAWRTATFWTAAIVGTALLNSGLKMAVQRTRPIDALYTGWSNFSFPSGHSAINFVMYASAAIILIRQMQPRWHIPSAVVLLSMAFAIACSRIYLGAHWASDVVAAISLGTAWLALLSASYFRKRPEPINVTAFIQTMCVMLLLVGAFNISQQHIDNIEKYRVTSAAQLTLAPPQHSLELSINTSKTHNPIGPRNAVVSNEKNT